MTSFSNDGAATPRFGNARWQGGCSARWNPFEIAVMVVGFAIWWPIGLAMLGFKFARRRGYTLDDAVGRARSMFAQFSGGGAQPRPWQPFASSATGNTAFDDWRTAEMARIEEERRKLDAAQKDFADHLDNLRRARDREEFDSFMAARRG